jgi:(p)ppGpp synthase/HD superfamily hydrolase
MNALVGNSRLLKTDLIERADRFAAAAHAKPRPKYPNGQFRSYTNVPYIEHPRNVAKLVAAAGLPEQVVAAALLHDVLEDTDVTIDDLRKEFGFIVSDLVMQVTDVSERAHGNRAVRKHIDRQHIAMASPYGQSIKAADLIDNTATVAIFDPSFARRYLPEKRKTLEVLTKADSKLLTQAWQSLADAEAKVFSDGDRAAEGR